MSYNQEAREIAIRIVDSASLSENIALMEWSQELLQVRKSSLSKIEKTKQALFITQKKKVLFPIIKILFKQIKRHVWDERGTKSRLGMMGIFAGTTFFAGQNAGIAALGGAVGVPLWIVFGAGGTFAGFLIEEVKRKNTATDTIKYSVLNAEKEKTQEN